MPEQSDADIDHEHADGCLCHGPVTEREATPDHDLPAAQGGVQGDRKPRKPKTDRISLKGDA